jgi:arylsulfatase A-like enzyme
MTVDESTKKPGPGTLPAIDTIAIVASGALLATLIENGSTIVQHLVLHRISGAPTGFLWLVPLYYSLAFGVLGLTVVILSQIMTRQKAFQLAIATTLALIAFILLLLGFYGKIHQWALVLIALGIGIQAARWAASRQDSIIRLARRFALIAGVMVIIPAIGNPPLQRWREKRELANLPPARVGAPNVLLIILDTVRAASLSLYGHTRRTTPHLEELAARAAVFDHAYVTAPWTLPSHATMFTGLYHHEMAADWLSPLEGQPPTLAEAFRDAGYETGGFVANLFYTQEETGLGRGFNQYHDFVYSEHQFLRTTQLGQFLDTWKKKDKPVRPTNARKLGHVVTDDFFAWLARKEAARPFFAFLNYFDAHQPYVAPAWLKQRFHSDSGLVEGYEAAIAALDIEVARIVDSLEHQGLLQNTIVIVSSDHGEQFGEHGIKDHGNSLYIQALHVPLMILDGRAPRGIRISEPISLRDLPRTVATMAGLPDRFPGQSLTRFWGSPAGDTESSSLLAEISQGIRLAPGDPASRGDMKSLIRDDLHLIVNGDGVLELYDLARDPKELVDLSDSAGYRDRRERLHDALREVNGLSVAP